MALVSEPTTLTMIPSHFSNLPNPMLLSNSDSYVATLPFHLKEGLIALLQDAVWQLDILAEITFSKTQEKKFTSTLLSSSKRNSFISSPDHLKISKERTLLQHLLKKAIVELTEGHVDSLIQAVQEERNRRNLLHDTLKREKELNQKLKELQKQLNEEQWTLDQERQERDTVMLRLREAIQEIQALTLSEQKYLKKETKAKETSVHHQWVEQELHWTEQLNVLTLEIEMEMKVHQTMVEYLNRQRSLLEKQIESWMEKYEQDVEGKLQELEHLKFTRTQEMEVFEDLVHKFEDLTRLMEDDRLQKLKAFETQQQTWQLKQQRYAALKIQRWWRSLYLTSKKTNVNPHSPSSTLLSSNGNTTGTTTNGTPMTAGSKKSSRGSGKSGSASSKAKKPTSK